MPLNISVGTTLADSFTVLEIKESVIPLELADYVNSSKTINLNSKYENQAYLLVYSLKNSFPPPDEWPFILPYGLSDVNVEKSWTPLSVDGESKAFAMRARTVPNGTLVSIVQVMGVKKKTFIAATVAWHGFPFINKFFVGSKPGMAERTEKLLRATLDLQR